MNILSRQSKRKGIFFIIDSNKLQNEELEYLEKAIGRKLEYNVFNVIFKMLNKNI